MKDKNEIVKIVSNVINNIDPENFKPGDIDGSPINEYEQEIRLISNFIIHKQEDIKLNGNILSEYINKVWNEYFGTNCNNLSEITARLYKSIM